MKPHELDINSPVYAGVLEMLGHEINDTIRDMITKNLPEGSVTLKFNIGIIHSYDEDGVLQNTMVFTPKLKSSIGRSRDEKLGVGGGRVEIDKDGKIIIGTNQISMDELLEEKEGA